MIQWYVSEDWYSKNFGILDIDTDEGYFLDNKLSIESFLLSKIYSLGLS